ncbi:MAG: hypothetical protein ACI9JL_002651 [Paracoccaceae bacterium]|jgi:hypothetical protein
MTVHEPAQENAMTEIALALAMGFFSLMVLTLISMGAGQSGKSAPQVLTLAPTTDQSRMATAAPAPGNDLIFIFDGKRFLDTELRPVDPQTVIQSMTGPARRVVLALDPSLPLKEAMAARARVNAPNLVVSSLDARWIKALATRAAGGSQ